MTRHRNNTATQERVQQPDVVETPGPNPATAVSLPVPSEALRSLETLADTYSLSALEACGRFERAFRLAQGIVELRRALRPHMAHILPLMGSPLGFKTDRDASDKLPPYSEDVVLECLIEATFRGVLPIGNQFNILARRCYITKEGYIYLLGRLKGFSDLKLQPGVPRMANGGAIVPYKATWVFNGLKQSIERQLCIKINDRMGVDAILGKAERKVRAAIYGQITGSEQSLADAEENEGVLEGDGQRALPGNGSRTDQVRDRLQARAEPQATPAQVQRLRAYMADWSPEEVEAFGRTHHVHNPQQPTREEADRMLQAVEGPVAAHAAGEVDDDEVERQAMQEVQ